VGQGVGAPRPVEVPGLGPTGPAWSQVTIASGLVFVSGQVAWNEDGEVIGASVTEQTEAVFENLRTALEGAGSSMRNLARICVYLTDPADIAGFREVRDRWLDGIRPASTLLIVSALADPGLRVEIDATATL
jgi:enamine deaminase RidA (YjgF/YER057c/UK114 family)